jgi:hypothetical protein
LIRWRQAFILLIIPTTSLFTEPFFNKSPLYLALRQRIPSLRSGKQFWTLDSISSQNLQREIHKFNKSADGGTQIPPSPLWIHSTFFASDSSSKSLGGDWNRVIVKSWPTMRSSGILGGRNKKALYNFPGFCLIP